MEEVIKKDVPGSYELAFAAKWMIETYKVDAVIAIGTLIKGLGEDHVLWGTDSTWYGSPQWQIEAFRRLEMPEDLRESRGFAALGEATGPLKNRIFWDNGAELYGLKNEDRQGHFDGDAIQEIKSEYLALGGRRSNKTYGYVIAG